MKKEEIKKYCENCEFYAPANINEIIHAERELNIEFHKDLKEILLESNGIHGEYKLELLWNVDEIRIENLKFRNNKDFKELYMPFENLLFFADAGNGDLFAYAIQNGKIRYSNIFVWNHEDDSRNWVAPTIMRYFEWWLTGELEI